MKSWKVMLCVLLGLVLCSQATANEEKKTWHVMCHPESYLCIRSKAGSHGQVVGYLYLGDSFQVDERKGEWLHGIGLSCEAGEGWVHVGFCTQSEVNVYSPAVHVIVRGNGRVRLRESMDGEHKAWVKPGDRVKVYATCDMWALTESGYVMKKYLETQAEEVQP